MLPRRSRSTTATGPTLTLIALIVTLVASSAPADGPADNIAEKVRPIPPKGTALLTETKYAILKGLSELQQVIAQVGKHELLPDVLIYEKAVRWALVYDEVYDGKAGKDGKGPPPAANVRKVLAAGLERAKALKDGKTPWTTQTGAVLRGYRSKIDGSVQPYWLIVPSNYDFAGDGKHRLDFWWHGRNELLSEANFMANAPVAGGIIPAPGAFILHPYGRYCNANKFAGEVDTFECLEHARKHYRIDEDRLVARGFSMGGAACWQFAVHYPTIWAAAAPGAGFSETPEFLKVFQKEDVKPTWYEQKLWHLYNASDYALNLFNLPTVAYSGEIDPQKQAAAVMAREMEKVGLELVHIIGPKTGHSYEANAKAEINKRIDAIVEKGRPREPSEIKFVTYTLRYNRCGWVTVEGLGRHWEQARLEASLSGKDGDKDRKATLKTVNVTALTIRLGPGQWTAPLQVEIDGDRLSVAPGDGKFLHAHFRLGTKGWEQVPSLEVNTLRKSPGLQGPIDDAFLDSFVMVAPTGQPYHEATDKWVRREMQHAIDHWRKQFRGDAPVKKDTEVSDDDIKNSNLVLWGDPRSNVVLSRINDKLPISWDEKAIVIGDGRYRADSHVLVTIYPNPLNPQRYVVLNSGFTFREYDYLNNARQVPKLPDYAILDCTTPPNSRYPGKVVRAGFYGEKWEILEDDGR